MLKKLIGFLQRNSYLVSIVLLAAALRFIFPDSPPSLNWDEISHGYNAFSILTVGKDEWGNTLPLIFRAYGDYKLPVYIYLTAISEFLFGLTPFAVRLPSILAGIGTTTFTFFLVEQLFWKVKNARKVGLIAALMVAIEPWSFFLSRAAFEANLALFFFVAAVFSFLVFVNIAKRKYILLSCGFFGLTVWTYNSYRIFTPLVVVALIVIYRNTLAKVFKKFPKTIYHSLIFLSIFLLPMFFQLFNSVGQARYSWVQILDQGVISRINEARGLGGSRLIHNKVTYFLLDFSKNYIAHFSPDFLFFNGGTNYQFSVPRNGLIYLINIPFLLFGLGLLLKRAIQKERAALFILSWFLLAPIPSSLTREAPHVLRAITFIPTPMIISAFGLVDVLSRQAKYSKLFLYSTYFLLLSLLTLRYMQTYFGDYTNKYSESWQYGYQHVSDFIDEYYTNYDKVVVSKKYGEPHEFLLFYLKWPLQKYIDDPKLNRFFQTNWYWVDGFDKFYFVNDWQIRDEGLGNYTFKQESGGLVHCTPKTFKCLLVTSPNNVPEGWNRVKYIHFLNGQTAFELYEN